MAVRIQLPSQPRPHSPALLHRHPVLGFITLGLLALVVLVLLVAGGIFGYYYVSYGKVVDARLQKPLFANTAKVYAAPRQVRTGQHLSARAVAAQLRAAGYSEEGSGTPSRLGTYALNEDAITVRPGPESYHAPEAATITFSGPSVQAITAAGGQALASYELEPLLITGLSDQTRTKRKLVTYDELPHYLVPAVTSIEDRRFFSHGGVDWIGAGRAVVRDITTGRKDQGGSTLTMQLARGFFLSPEKRFKRKLIEIAISYQLENRFSKQELFAMYANQIPLGQQGSFAINGFGEAAEVYFGKDVSRLNLPECALLAGIIQSPSRLNPVRHPQRAVDRRNLVLDAMVETGAITKAQAEEAKATPLHLATAEVSESQAPYFVDLVRDQISARLGDNNWNQEGLRIYTSLDPDLQSAASAAVDAGMKVVDALVEKRNHSGEPGPTPQVALIALDPHTGQVLALVGGRNYGQSQYDHAVAHRPTGSIFKPFVYAAAFNSSLAGAQLTDANGQQTVFSQVMLLNGQPQTFETASGQSYTPRNFHGESYDQGTARFALQRSNNNATIALAQQVGFDNVAALARDAGIKSARGTPSVAIGAYDASPLEMAGAYTVFANAGVKVDPWLLASVRTSSGDPLNDYAPQSRPTLDPRVAYLTTNMMENVINAGTAAKVRALGFSAPAAGKTGTSNDAWFAGYTSNLLCIVWVGNDDYSDIHLQGADAAAPIWAEFMKRAVQLPQYSDTKPFTPPSGVSLVQLDKATNLLPDQSCPDQIYTVAFLDGTQPTDTCDHSNGDQRSIFQKIFGVGENATPTPQPQAAPQPPAGSGSSYSAAPGTSSASAAQTTAPAPAPPPVKKPGFFGRLFGQRPKQEPAPAPSTTAPQQP